jgi:hypothetical protein
MICSSFLISYVRFIKDTPSEDSLLSYLLSVHSTSFWLLESIFTFRHPHSVWLLKNEAANPPGLWDNISGFLTLHNSSQIPWKWIHHQDLHAEEKEITIIKPEGPEVRKSSDITSVLYNKTEPHSIAASFLWFSWPSSLGPTDRNPAWTSVRETLLGRKAQVTSLIELHSKDGGALPTHK